MASPALPATAYVANARRGRCDGRRFSPLSPAGRVLIQTHSEETDNGGDPPASTPVGLRAPERTILGPVVPTGLSLDAATSRGAARRSEGLPAVVPEQPQQLLLPPAGRRPSSARRRMGARRRAAATD